MKKILREPLLHFLALGIGLFLAYGLMPKSGGSNEPEQIVVTQGQIASMAAGFAKTWQRPPTAEELAGLVSDRVREEIYYREALALGLDKDDTIVRRRLRQKMEFIFEDITAQAEPKDADLDAYLQSHADAFRIEPRYTFHQIFLNPEKHGDNLARDAAQILAQLNQAGGQADISSLGDSFLLGNEFTALFASEVVKQFGAQFAANLGGLVPGQWQGPVESGYGMHLVLVTQRTAGGVPTLAEVRDAVRRDRDNARRLEANERFYQELLKRYTVTIDPPEPVVANTVAEAMQR